MTKRLITLLLLSFLLVSCGDEIEIDPESGFEVFTIPSGAHNSILRNESFTGSGIDIKVIFDESAIYTLDEVSDQADINKLVGFSDCAQDHQSESARIGWRWFNNELQILAYTYREGDLSFELMGAIPLNEEIDLSIRAIGEAYNFTGEGLESISMPRASSCESGENYWLWPYFGGDQVAPQTITIKLKREMVE